MVSFEEKDLESPDWKEKCLQKLNNCKVEELFDICKSNWNGFPFIYFDRKSTKNLEKKKNVLIKFITGENTKEDSYDKEVFELIPDNVDEITFN